MENSLLKISLYYNFLAIEKELKYNSLAKKANLRNQTVIIDDHILGPAYSILRHLINYQKDFTIFLTVILPGHGII